MSSPDAPQPTEYSATLDLRWSDFDRLGHLNQAVYHVLMEQARTGWLAQVRVHDDWERHAFVLARVELDYRREIDASHRQVVGTLRPVKIGTSSVICEQQIRWLDGTVAATGHVVMVAWDGPARTKRELTVEERAAMQA